MYKKIQYMLSSLLVLAMLVACVPTGMAAEEQTSGTVPVTISASAPIFSVTVPTTLPIHMDAYGGITCGDITITNNSSGPVMVEDTQIASLNGWTLVNYATTNFTDANRGQHRAALRFDRDSGRTAAGSTTGQDIIPAQGGTQRISLSAKIPSQGVDAVNTNIAQVTFVLGWYSVIVLEGPEVIQWNSLGAPSASLKPSDGSKTYEWRWESSAPHIVDVSSGWLTIKDVGQVTITASKDGTVLTKDIDITWDKNTALGQAIGNWETFGLLSGGNNTSMGGQQVGITSAWDGQRLSCLVGGYMGNGTKISFATLCCPASAIASMRSNLCDFVLSEDGYWISTREIGTSENLETFTIIIK